MATAHFSGIVDSVGGFSINGTSLATSQTIATLTATTGNITTVNATTVNAGASGTAGTVNSFPTTASKGKLIVAAVANTGNTNTTISNAAMGQASVVSIPDPGAATANFVLDAGTASTITATKISTGATPVPIVDIAGTTLTPAAGAANVCNVSIQFKDGAGTAIARRIPYHVYLSDSATGDGVTGTTASGTVTHTTGTDIVALTAKKVIYAISNGSGLGVLAITDTAKTGFYIAVTGASGVKVSAQLVTGNYG